MAKFEFWLSDEDTDRVFALKKKAGQDELTGNEYAKILLQKELHRLHPGTVKYDEAGEIITDNE